MIDPTYAKLMQHWGKRHKIVVVGYGDIDQPDEMCVECDTCHEVLVTFDRYSEEGDKNGADSGA